MLLGALCVRPKASTRLPAGLFVPHNRGVTAEEIYAQIERYGSCVQLATTRCSVLVVPCSYCRVPAGQPCQNTHSLKSFWTTHVGRKEAFAKWRQANRADYAELRKGMAIRCIQERLDASRKGSL